MGSITEEPAAVSGLPAAEPVEAEADIETDIEAEGGAPGKRRIPIWVRYAAGSVVATIFSQIAFTVCYGALDASAAVASLVAWVAGAGPNYLLNKAWAWNDRSVSRRRAIISYLLVIGVTNLLAIGMTTLADSWVRAHVASHGDRTILVDLAYLGSYGVMFVVKFLLFDGLVFKTRRRPAG